MPTVRHPIENIVPEDVRAGVDEVGEHFLGSRFFLETGDAVMVVKTDDAESGGVLNFP